MVPAASPPEPRNTVRRRVLLALALLAAGILPVVALEAGLRMFGYGYATEFFIPVPDRNAYTSNERFGWRFFPPSIARVPVASVVSSPKPPGTFRIFVLGDSAAMGIPEPAFGFSRMLRAQLEARYPNTRIEVVNTAMTAINSYVLPPIASAAARLQPDLFIVLAGNNEVVGPYGPGTVLAKFTSSRWLIRAGVWFRGTRTAQLMESVLARFTKEQQPREWGGMAMFSENKVPETDARLSAVYRNFSANLRDVCRVAKRAGAGCLLVTVPVNLRDNPPFASVHHANLAAADLAAWDKLYREGAKLESERNWAAAIPPLERAAAIDGQYADLEYLLGRCLMEEGRLDEARQHLVRARDLDALRFRADSHVIESIRNVAHGENLPLADAERAFSTELVGNNAFYEHVHLTFEGNYRLTAMILPFVEQSLHESPVRASLSRQALPEAMGYTEWDRDKSVMEMLSMMRQPPFTLQSGFAEADEARRLLLGDLQRTWADPARVAEMSTHLARYEKFLSRHPDDPEIREILAELHSKSGNHEAAARAYRQLLGLVPSVARWHANLAHELLEQGNTADARREVETALSLDPQLAAAHFTLAAIFERGNQTGEAVAQYQSALRMNPGYADAHLRLGVIFTKEQHLAEAVEQYREYTRLTPGDAAAQSNLGFLLAKTGDLNGAVQHYREALRIDPRFAPAAVNFGAALERLGRKQEAIEQYKNALRLRPDLAVAHTHLENLAQGRNN